jgi:homoserine dehydrogenase
VVRVALLGYGRIGQAVAAFAHDERDRLAACGVELRCTTALVRDCDRVRPGAASIELVTEGRLAVDRRTDVVVEALGGIEPARSIVTEALRLGIPVVTANKSLLAAHGPELRALAARHETPFFFEAAALAGVPCLGAFSRRPLLSSVTRIAGILNGTSHVILSAVERGVTFDDALASAVRDGYAEPDSAADVSGRDAAEKLTVLLQLAGRISVRTEGLPSLGISAITPSDFDCAHRLGGTLKPIALASLARETGGAWIGPGFVPEAHAFRRLTGVTNALHLTGNRGRDALFIGPGAGPGVTAATIIDDVVEAVTSPPSSAAPFATVDPDGAALSRPPRSAWFVRLDRSRYAARDVAEFLAASGVPAIHVVEREDAIALLTVPSSWRVIQEAIHALDGVLVLPVLETTVPA